MFYKSCLIALARDRYSESALARTRKTEREREREKFMLDLRLLQQILKGFKIAEMFTIPKTSPFKTGKERNKFHYDCI